LKKLAAELGTEGESKPSSRKIGGLATPKTSPKAGYKRPSSDEEPLTPTPRRTKRRAAQNVKYDVDFYVDSDEEDEFPPNLGSHDDSSEDEYSPFEPIVQSEDEKEVGEIKREATSGSEQGIAEKVEKDGRVSNEIKALGRELQDRTQSPVKSEVLE
jgi:hypothetical protein